MHSSVESQLSKDTNAFISGKHGHFINGETMSSASKAEFDVINPATEEVFTRVADGQKTDVDMAVAAAREAFDNGPWRSMTPSARARHMFKLADLLEQHAPVIAEIECVDNGKSKNVAQFADVPLAAENIRYYAGFCTKLEGSTIPLSVPYTPGAEYHAYTLREPVGVVAQIIPWNFPLLMAAWKIGPALAAGCTIILKPAEQTPMSALYLGKLVQEAGFPQGVLNIVTGAGETGAALAAHPDVDKVAFTGSTEVGRLVLQAAQGNLKKVSLELGGKSPNVVFADADLKAAAAGAANAIFFNHGQCCAAGSRMYIEESVFEQTVEQVAAIAKGMKLGSGLDAATHMGPLVSKEQQDRVVGYLEAGKKEGATVVTGGGRHGDKGYFVEPTVLANTKPNMTVIKEEIFGPVVTATPFKNREELIHLANDSVFGLAAGVWTKDLSKGHQMAKALKAGTVWVNCYNVYDAALPFGGFKQSGWGREMGAAALDLYTETKSVCVQL